MELRGIGKHQRWLVAATPAALLLLLANLITFVLLTDNGVVRFDYWRFVELIERYHAGDLSIDHMLHPVNGPFRSLLSPGLILADGLFLHLDLVSIHLLAPVLLFLASLLVYREFRRSTGFGPVAGSLMFVPLAAVLLSPRLHNIVAHGQATHSMIRASVFLAAFALLGRVLAPGRPGPWSWTFAAAAVVIAVFVGKGWLPAFFSTIVGMLLLKVTFDRAEAWRNRLPLATITAVFAISLFVFAQTMVVSLSRAPDPVAALTEHTGEALRFWLVLIGNGVLSTGGHQSAALLIAAGACSVLLAAWAIFLCMTKKIWRQAWCPLALVVYPLLAMTTITLARVDVLPKAAFATRYFTDSPLWQVGVFWLLLLVAPRVRKPRQVAYRTTVAALLVFVVAWDGVLLLQQWRRAPYIAQYKRNVAEALLASDQYTDQELSRRLGTNARQFRYVRPAILTMKRYRLNVFADGAHQTPATEPADEAAPQTETPKPAAEKPSKQP